MSDLKITVEQLKNYLGTSIEYMDGDLKRRMGTSLTTMAFLSDFLISDRIIHQIKPICYRLSDLDKFIPELGFVPEVEVSKIFNLNVVAHCVIFNNTDFEEFLTLTPFSVAQQLIQWHFWPFGDEYFEQGLVIDKLKSGKEPKS